MRSNTKWVFILMGLLGTHSILAQERQGQDMDEMWGDQSNLGQRTDSLDYSLFRDGNYAMFIHWGIYSNIANLWEDSTYYGISEWIKHPRRADISDEAYKAEAANFHPVHFDARAVVALAKQAGMKYIVITSKHHDGFAMYDSKSCDFNIVQASPFGRDPMKELADACEEAGLGFGFYYSHNQDWTFPGGKGGPSINEAGEPVGFDYYFEKKCLPQVAEITTNYGDIDLVWFDTPGNMEKKYVEELVRVVRTHQPDALISGRVGHGLGDYQSLGDMAIPLENIPGLWESVDVTNDSWGYAWYDENWKSPKRILKSVISTVARGGTYMLNVGLKPDGSIPAEAARALSTSGEWISRYPQVIYQAGPSPWGHQLPWGDATMHGDKINLCLYDWPLDGKIFLPGLENEISQARLWVNGEQQPLETERVGTWTAIHLPARRPEKLVSVVELTIRGALEVDQATGIDPVYPTTLPVDFAEAKACAIAEKRWMEKFGEWKHVKQAQDWTPEGKVTWTVEVMAAGDYQVDLAYTGRGRMVWRIENEEGDLLQNQQNACAVYTFYAMGLLTFEKPGKHTVSVSFMEGEIQTASLQAIRFTPWESVE